MKRTLKQLDKNNRPNLYIKYIFKSQIALDPVVILAAPLTFFKNEPILINGVYYTLQNTDLYEEEDPNPDPLNDEEYWHAFKQIYVDD